MPPTELSPTHRTKAEDHQGSFRAEVARLVAESRVAQGLPVRVEDDETLDVVARVLAVVRPGAPGVRRTA